MRNGAEKVDTKVTRLISFNTKLRPGPHVPGIRFILLIITIIVIFAITIIIIALLVFALIVVVPIAAIIIDTCQFIERSFQTNIITISGTP
jgi:hypothetical protein